ncbi:MAG: hypothetical protein ABI697_05850 [Devosia sp.]
MSDTSVIAILASVGILLAGAVTADAAALASAVQQGTPTALENFVRANPASALAPDALWLAADLSTDRLDSSATSSENPALTCKLSMTHDGKSATVDWTIAGATKVSIVPLGFKKDSKIPLKGSKSIDFDGYLLVTLIAEDAEGHQVKCSVIAQSNAQATSFQVTADPGTTGFSDPN